MTWVGWKCKSCGKEYKNDPHICVCGYTVFDPITGEEKPEWSDN